MHKERGSVVGKMLPVMFSILFGMIIVMLCLDTIRVLNVKRNLDCKLNEEVHQIIEGASDTDVRDILTTVAEENCSIYNSNLNVTVSGSGRNRTFVVELKFTVDNSILDDVNHYTFEYN